jgi:L-arabinose isomerase
MLDLVASDSDKLMSRARFGYSVTAIDIDVLAHAVSQVSDRETDRLAAACAERYDVTASLRRGGRKHRAFRDSVRTELGLRSILDDGGFRAFTYNLEDLHGLERLPGLAVQRLMEDGYGFSAEGDWKTAALVRTMKVMSSGLSRGATFLADDGYEFGGSDGPMVTHSLEVCPSIAAGRPIAGIQPPAIGGKAELVRLVFAAPDGCGVVASTVQIGNLCRIIVNEVDVGRGKPLPEPSTARVELVPRPNREVAAAAWIYAGGAHNAGFSQALTTAHLEDFAGMAGIEFLCIDADTKLRSFRNEIRWNDLSRSRETWRLSAAEGRETRAPEAWHWQYNREPFRVR